MANTSIYNAFSRFWTHVVARIGDAITECKNYTDSKVVVTAQIITLEQGDT